MNLPLPVLIGLLTLSFIVYPIVLWYFSDRLKNLDESLTKMDMRGANIHYVNARDEAVRLELAEAQIKGDKEVKKINEEIKELKEDLISRRLDEVKPEFKKNKKVRVKIYAGDKYANQIPSGMVTPLSFKGWTGGYPDFATFEGKYLCREKNIKDEVWMAKVLSGCDMVKVPMSYLEEIE
jgi:hypothetical protein